MRIRIAGFLGMSPRAGARLLDQRQAQIARNCDLRSGEIRPLQSPAPVTTLSGQFIDRIYRWRVGDEVYWLRFRGDADVVRTPLDQDVWQRVYFTGDTRFDGPRYTYTPIAIDGGTEYPIASRKLGVPAPIHEVSLSPKSPVSGAVANVFAEFPVRVETSSEHGVKTGQVVRFEGVDTSTAPDFDSEADYAEGDRVSYENRLYEATEAINAGDFDPFKWEPVSDLSEFLEGVDGFQVTVESPTEFTLDGTDGTTTKANDLLGSSWTVYHPEQFKEKRFYTHTYVTNLGEEGPPQTNDVLPNVTVGRMQEVTVTLPSLDPNAGQGRVIDKRRIYRTASGNQGAAFQFLAEVSITDTEFTDDKTGEDLAEVLQSTDYGPPPAGLYAITSHPGGFLVGAANSRVYLSEPYLPHAWPDYSVPLDQEPVALGVFDTSIVVATKGRPYLITGSDPRSMQPRNLELNEGCVAKRSLVSLGYAVVYASVNGLVMVSSRGAELVTRNLITEEEWAAYKPETMHAYEHEGRYIVFYDGGGLMFDPREPGIGLIELSESPVAAHHDPLEPKLYLLRSNGEILQWDAGETMLSCTYRSGVIPMPYPANIGAMQVYAVDYASLHVEVFADGVSVYSQPVVSQEPFVMPAGYRAREFEWQLTGSSRVQEVVIAEAMRELSA